MAKKVRKIPATLNQFTSEPVAVRRKKKVAGYARVSTDREEQATSYEAQMTYYKTYIEGHEDWEFVGMYSDEGITATNTKKRDGFNQMVEDALDGKIDLIITKSVSRFARNTVDSLSTIRKLKEKGIEIYFEKEKEEKLRTLYGEKHSRFQELEALIQEKNDTKEILTNFITKLEDLTGEQTEFREELWGGLVDHIRIDEKSSTVVFRGGIEITI